MAEPAGSSAEISETAETPVRGRPFQPGQSGNPTGRPKGMASAVRRVLDRAAAEARARLEAEGKDVELAVTDGQEIIVRFWAGIMGDTSEKTTDRLAASKLLSERGWGKPPEHAPIEDGDPLDWGEEQLADAAGEFDSRVIRLSDRRRAGGAAPGGRAEA